MSHSAHCWMVLMRDSSRCQVSTRFLCGVEMAFRSLNCRSNPQDATVFCDGCKLIVSQQLWQSCSRTQQQMLPIAVAADTLLLLNGIIGIMYCTCNTAWLRMLCSGTPCVRCDKCTYTTPQCILSHSSIDKQQVMCSIVLYLLPGGQVSRCGRCAW